MNKTAIRNFAVTAREKLMDAIGQKAYELGITKTEIKEPEVYKDGFRVNDKFYKKYQIEQREKLISNIKNHGLEQVLEEVAYTWFNRLIAIRFMEVNEYLPTGVRVLSSADSDKTEPDAVSEVLDIADELELDLDKVYRLQDENNSEELFQYILVKQCNKLGDIIPMMFEQIEDYTELLLPDHLLAEGSVVRDLVKVIEEEDWKEQVEIIGWLYQYYISEKKDQVFADLKKNKKITKENIPAATQLFTPKWIVQYMVENSLGRLWLESHPNKELQKDWRYFLAEPEQEVEVRAQLEKGNSKKLSPEDIKVLDPCMGSGHILVYAFDILFQIYKSAGYKERDIPQLILEKNLYGLDIDDRAAQLAYFALLMKARSYNRRLFTRNIQLNLCSIQESNDISEDAIDYFIKSQNLDSNDVSYLVEIFQNAKVVGSLIELKEIHLTAIEEGLEKLKEQESDDIFSEMHKEVILEIFPELVKQARLLLTKYDISITNPPYMGSSGMNKDLLDYLKSNFNDTKGDLFSTFIKRGFDYVIPNGFNVLVTMQTWMFLSSYEKLRNYILGQKSIVALNHMGNNVMGIAFGTSATIFRNVHANYKGIYTYVDYKDINKEGYPSTFPIINDRYSIVPSSNFTSIPAKPIAYWLNDNLIDIFKNEKNLGEIGKASEGVKTGDNEKFLKLWYEVSAETFSFGKKPSSYKWIPHHKGGEYRKWYGNLTWVINWENDGQEIKASKNSGLQGKNMYFKEVLAWSKISNKGISLRYIPKNMLFDSGSPAYQTEDRLMYYVLGFLNSNVASYLLQSINPSVNFQVRNIETLPIIVDESRIEDITNTVKENIALMKKNWDKQEISWDFINPLFQSNRKEYTILEEFIHDSLQENKSDYETLISNEEKINEFFVQAYQLEDIVSPKVKENEVSISLSDIGDQVLSFISYAVGVILGRYGLNQNGLVYAGGKFDENVYQGFKPDMDNIIPITDDEYFEDDIVTLLIKFISVCFGKDTLEENLEFIASALNKKTNETARQRIRRYFVKEFFANHVKTYQKHPIYWMFDSGKNDGFKALIYMHRYDVGTVARVRTDYLHALQRKYEAEMTRLDMMLESDVSPQEKTKVKKQKEKIQMQLFECQQYDLIIAHVANQKIEIDLDAGIKNNYELFQHIEVPQGEGKKPLKANVLATI